MPAGRPTLFTQALADEIAERLANGETMKSICADEHMPSPSTVFRWELAMPEFGALVTRAREAGAYAIVGESREIADDGRNDWMEKHFRDHVSWVVNGEAVARSRLRVDQRWKEAMALAPRTFGQKTQIEHSGSIVLVNSTVEELEGELLELLASGRLKLPQGMEVIETEDDEDEFADLI